MGLPTSALQQTVADAMITNPKTHSAEITVSEADDAFADPHVHMLLLTRGGALHGTLLRADLGPHLDPRRPAIELATLGGRTIGQDRHIDDALQLFNQLQTRRLAVTDINHTLLGLLCLNRTLRGFCNESDILARTRGQTVRSSGVVSTGRTR